MQKRQTSARSLREKLLSAHVQYLQVAGKQICFSLVYVQVVLTLECGDFIAFLNKATSVSVQRESREWTKLKALFLYCFCKDKPRIIIKISNLTAKHQHW